MEQRIAQNTDYTRRFNWGVVWFRVVVDYSLLDADANYQHINLLPLDTVLTTAQKAAIQNKLNTYGILVDISAAVTFRDAVQLVKSVMV